MSGRRGFGEVMHEAAAARGKRPVGMDETCIHNARCRYTDGFYCEDCRNFFHRDSDVYRRHELPSSLYMVVNNIGVDQQRAGRVWPPEVTALCDRLQVADKVEDDAGLEALIAEARAFAALYGKDEHSAEVGLR